MSVVIQIPGKQVELTDDGAAAWAYTVTAAGVLQIIKIPSGKRQPTVDQELSASGWMGVAGARYTGDTSRLNGPSPSWPASMRSRAVEYLG